MNSAKKTLYIMGAGGFGREVADLILQSAETSQKNYNLKGFLDDAPKQDECQITGFPIFKYDEQLFDDNASVVIAIGNAKVRETLFDRLSKAGVEIPTLIHPSASVSRFAHVSIGSIICQGVIVNAGASIRENVILNVLSTIGHDASVGAHSVIGPSSVVCGYCRIGNCVELGACACMLPSASLGDYGKLGSNSTLIRRGEEGAVYFGTPAKKIFTY